MMACGERHLVELERPRVAGDDMKEHAWILPDQSIDGRQDDGHGNRLGRSDAYFPGRWIGEEVDILDTLAQVVEDRDAAFAESETIGRRRNSAPAAVNKLYSERSLQFHHRLGNGGLGYAEAARRLPHAAGFNDRHQNIEVA